MSIISLHTQSLPSGSCWPPLTRNALKSNISPVILLKQGMANLFQHTIDHFYKCWSSLALPILLCCVNALHRADEWYRTHPTTNRSCSSINSLIPPSTSLTLEGIRLDAVVAEIFQHLGTRISFQAKESSNPKQTTQSFHPNTEQLCTVWCLLQDPLNRSLLSLDNLHLRWEDPFLHKINHEVFILNFSQKTYTLHWNFWLLFFFSLNFKSIKIGVIKRT